MTYLMSKLSALTAAFAELLPSQSVQDAKLCFIVTETVRRVTGRFTKSSASRSLSNNPVGFWFKIFRVQCLRYFSNIIMLETFCGSIPQNEPH